MKGFKNTWVEGVHYDVIPQSEISKINKKISEDSTFNVNYQAERIYSELEVIELLNNFRIYSYNHGCGSSEFLEWFEQFSKLKNG